MKGAMIRCVRCKGRKKLYKVRGAYSYLDTGGEKIDCPMCLGKGTTMNLADALEEIKDLNSKKSVETKEKDFDDGDKKESRSTTKRVEAQKQRRKAD